MKIMFNLVVAVGFFFSFSEASVGQCPQICDGNQNTALGDAALSNNATGSLNTAVGFAALTNNATGIANTAFGHQALLINSDGVNNTATGFHALLGNSVGNENTAVGKEALAANGTGSNNTAVGSQAMQSNGSGIFNTALGLQSLLFNSTGSFNTVIGGNALLNSTSGDSNIALGFSAGISLTSGSNNIYIGSSGATSESKTIRIGNRNARATYIGGISGSTVAGGVPVIIDNTGRLGTTTSSVRFKKDIRPMDKASETILSLKPVIFRYNQELDPAGVSQFGLVAEEVGKVNPELVVRDEEGKPYTVRYEAVNAMLLNEFLKEHRRVEEQVRVNQKQEDTIAELKLLLKEQAAQILQIRTELAVGKSGSELVAVKD